MHGKNFSNSGLQVNSSCALSVTVTQLCLIYKLQRLVTFSAFVFVTLLCNVCDFYFYGFLMNLDFFLVIMDISRVVHET